MGVVLLEPQNTCGLDLTMSLKQIQMCSQGAFVEERRVFTKDDHLITFVTCQSTLAQLDLLSIAAEKYPCVLQISKMARLVTVYPDFSTYGKDVGHAFFSQT